jgi:F-type H+-transporting ATPase subunit b
MRRLGRLLLIAGTPLALTVLFSESRSRAQEEVAAEAAPGEEAVHDPIPNLTSFSYNGKNTEGEPWHEGQHKMPPPFIAALFNFAAFAFLVGRAAGPSVKKVVRERHDAIAKALEESAQLRDQARARLAEYEKKTAGLQQEIDILVAGIRTEAEAEAKRIIAEAEARAARMRKDAELQINAEMQRVRLTLEREAVQAAVTAAEQLLRDKTSDADQRALADKFVKSLQGAAKRPRA